MKAIYKMEVDFGRMGNVSGVFVADKDAVKQLDVVYFGEILGKHSEVQIDFNDPDVLTMVTDDPAVVTLFEDYKLSSGYDPFDYL